MVFRAGAALALLLAGSCAFSVLSPTRTVRATGALRGATSASASRGAAAAAGGVVAAAGVAALCGVAALRRTSRVACRSKQYWEGEWICADCGYIYNERAFGMKFEDMVSVQNTGRPAAGLQVPAVRRAAAPLCAKAWRQDRHHFGWRGGDTPIIIFTAVCLLIVLGIAYYSLQ